MPRDNHLLYFVVAAALTSLLLGNGRAVGSEASSPGSLHFRSVSDVKHEPAASTRRGSLAFKFDDQNAAPGRLQILAHLL